jgi:hypothetical protein
MMPFRMQDAVVLAGPERHYLASEFTYTAATLQRQIERFECLAVLIVEFDSLASTGRGSERPSSR